MIKDSFDKKSETLFDEFNFNVLNDNDYKEDSVREDIVTPILNALGYSSGGDHKIIRSKSITDPAVYFGTKKRKINIIPDYILETKDNIKWILDAKSPNEKITTGKNVEQAYSYAIHPEIRADFYALCNGREFVLFNIKNVEPILQFNLVNFKNEWKNIYTNLSPIHLANTNLKDFNPDFGIFLYKIDSGGEPFKVPMYINNIYNLNE